MAAGQEFLQAVRAVVAALHEDGLRAAVEREGPTFARLAVVDPSDGASARVELGVDWRANPPARIDLGPVLHADDTVANKLCALFGRGAPRDYIDVDGIMSSGRYTIAELLELAAEHDPGFDTAMFAGALRAIDQFAASVFEPYGMSPDDRAALRERIAGYADQVHDGAGSDN